jgi:GNAT superfamily N-acetyltransferase
VLKLITHLTDKDFLITNATELEFNLIYKKYVHDFPIYERKTYDYLKKLLLGKQVKLLLAKNNALHILGYAFIYEDKSEKIWWLEYIAITSEFRGCGIGSTFFKKIINFMAIDYLGMVLEVEIPNSPIGKELQLQYKRLKFYEKLGAKRLDVDYYYPHQQGFLPMYLYFFPLTDYLPKVALENAITHIFQEIHDDIKDVDDILKKINSSIKDHHFIEN